MGLTKGKTNNLNGRPKGSPNKTTKEIKEAINLIVSNNIETLQSDIDSLDPKDRIKVICDLFKYVVPSLSSSELKTDYSQLSDNQLDFIINQLKNNSNE
jgi:hypothetical protein